VAERILARRETLRRLKRLPHPELRAEAERLWQRVPESARAALPRLTLNWDELIKLQGEGLRIESHTVSHPILAHLEGDELRRELKESKRRIGDGLGTSPEFLAYPDGAAASISAEAEREALAHYRAAFTTVQNVLVPRASASRLPRIGARPTDTVGFLDFKINLYLTRELIRHVLHR
jgi:peptidoglycan/xylan/chitin deacetylase (PgdA/CDA1 family)